MSFVSEFKAFVQRGNVIDLAVGVIMGGAFGKIVTSLVSDVLMPPIGYVIGGIKFTDLVIPLPGLKIPDPLKAGEFLVKEPVELKIGNFLQSTFDFLIIAFCVFLLVKAINSMKRAEPVMPPPALLPTETEKLLMEIRDILRSK